MHSAVQSVESTQRYLSSHSRTDLPTEVLRTYIPYMPHTDMLHIYQYSTRPPTAQLALQERNVKWIRTELRARESRWRWSVRSPARSKRHVFARTHGSGRNRNRRKRKRKRKGKSKEKKKADGLHASISTLRHAEAGTCRVDACLRCLRCDGRWAVATARRFRSCGVSPARARAWR